MTDVELDEIREWLAGHKCKDVKQVQFYIQHRYDLNVSETLEVILKLIVTNRVTFNGNLMFWVEE